jgi:FkbM family methyltransferase
MSGMIGSVRDGLADLIRDVTYRTGFRLSRLAAPVFLEPLLHRQLQRKGRLLFVQIGANDGRSFDPIYRFVNQHRDRVAGVVVEPVKPSFESLQRNYRRHPGVATVNAAIHNTEREMTIHRVDPRRLKGLPSWARGTASFDLEHHRRMGTPLEAIISETVPCMTLAELLERHGPRDGDAELDLLVIDTEGYDAEIVRSIDFERTPPQILRFEHGVQQGMMAREVLDELLDLLRRHGYENAIERMDVTSYRPEVVVD